jgi:hypothetical protein
VVSRPFPVLQGPSRQSGPSARSSAAGQVSYRDACRGRSRADVHAAVSHHTDTQKAAIILKRKLEMMPPELAWLSGLADPLRCGGWHATSRTAVRLMAIAHALDGFSRAEAARLEGMERQAPSPPAAQARPGCTPAHTLGGANPTTSAGGSRAASCTPSRVASGHQTAYLAPKSPTRSDPHVAQ